MSAPAARVQPDRVPTTAVASRTTPEMRFWRGYRSPLLVKENNAVTHISFSPTSPHDFAVTSSTRVQIFSAKTRQVTKTIARFKDIVYSGEFRADGKLLVAGDATGMIQVFDTGSRSVLVTLQPSQYPVHVTKFDPLDKSRLLSASDDKVARLWDLTSPTPIVEFAAHGDYIRDACFLPSVNLIATGCYDGFTRLWDPRVGGSSGGSTVALFKQDDPVEAVANIESSSAQTLLAVGGGPRVRVWDISAAKRIKDLVNFQKTVTCLADAGDRGLLAGSLDGHVKVFDSSSPKWDVKFGWKYGGAILSVGISPNKKHIVTGLTSGLVTIRTRKTDSANTAATAMAPRNPLLAMATPGQRAKSSNFAKLIRGAQYQGEQEHIVINDQPLRKPKKLKTYEKHIAAFRWSEALDSAFASGTSADQTLAVLRELKRRGKVGISLSGRDEGSLEPILKWAVTAVQDSRCACEVADWVGCIVDMYGPLIERSPALETLVRDLKRRVTHEVERARESSRIEGMLTLLLSH